MPTPLPRTAASGLRWLLAALATWIPLAVPAVASTGTTVVAASGGDHLWLAVPSPDQDDAYGLRLLAETMEADAYGRLALPLAARPEAIAADGQRLVVVMRSEGTGGAGTPRREVFSLRIVRHEPLDTYMTRPSGRMALEAPLPAEGRLVGLVGTRTGPVALLAGEPAGADAPRARLLALRGPEWIELPLPEGLAAFGPMHLAVQGERAETLVLLTAAPDARAGDDPGVLHRLEPAQVGDGETAGAPRWTSRSSPVDPTRVRWLTRLGDQVAAVLEGDGADRAEVGYLRPSGLARIAMVDLPDEPWTIRGLGETLVLLTARLESPDSGPVTEIVTAARIDPTTGERSETVELRSHRPRAVQFWMSLIVLSFLLLGVLMMLMVRPDPVSPPTIPEGARALPMSRRLLALAVDLAIAAGITMLLLQVTPAELARLPVIHVDTTRTVPYIVMSAIAVLLGAIGEGVAGRSAGKLLVGGGVVDPSCGRPGARAVVLRGFGKLLTLIVPFLGLFVLINPASQGIGDVLARTFVVDRSSMVPGGEPGEGEGSPSDEED